MNRTTVLDSSGNGLNGIVHNVTRGKGRVGNALTFSGQDSFVLG